MNLFNVGRICVKLAGRDAGKKCVILSEAKEGKVLIDGATRRREVSIKHLEPLADTVSIAANAATGDVASALKAMNIEVKETKAKKAGTRPKRMKKVKKGGKSAAKKAEPKVKEAKVVKETKKTEVKETKAPAKNVEEIFEKKE